MIMTPNGSITGLNDVSHYTRRQNLATCITKTVKSHFLTFKFKISSTSQLKQQYKHMHTAAFVNALDQSCCEFFS